MAVKQTTIKADEALQQRKTFYRALSENVQSVLFFWHGVALFAFAFALGMWTFSNYTTQKELIKTNDIISVNNVVIAQIKAEYKVQQNQIIQLNKTILELKK